MSSKLYVGNLSYDTTEEELTETFSEAGTVTSCSIVLDRETQRSRGFAFVEMSSADEAKAAIETFAGKEISGRPLVVNEARPREDRPRGGGGGGGGGYGGGGGGGYSGGGGGGGGFGGFGGGGGGGGGGGKGRSSKGSRRNARQQKRDAKGSW